MCNTSHVTRHTSHITHHTSHVTHHKSHITHRRQLFAVHAYQLVICLRIVAASLHQRHLLASQTCRLNLNFTAETRFHILQVKRANPRQKSPVDGPGPLMPLTAASLHKEPVAYQHEIKNRNAVVTGKLHGGYLEIPDKETGNTGSFDNELHTNAAASL